MDVYYNKKSHEFETLKVLKMKGYPTDKPEVLEMTDWFKVEYNYPKFDIYTQKLVVKNELVWNEEKKVFVQNFDIVPLTADEKSYVLEHQTELAFERLRQERNSRLSDTDYLLMVDYPISEDDLVKVKAYRQALRDLPKQEGSPWLNNVIPWPNKPSFIEE